MTAPGEKMGLQCPNGCGELVWGDFDNPEFLGPKLSIDPRIEAIQDILDKLGEL